MTKRMIYYVSADVEKATGSQTWKVEATSEEEALQLVRNGEGEFFEEEVEVYRLGKRYITGTEEIVVEAERETSSHIEERGK